LALYKVSFVSALCGCLPPKSDLLSVRVWYFPDDLSFYNFYLIPITEEEIINANVYIYIPPSIQNRNLINLILNAINSSNLLNNEEENEEEQEKLTEEEFNNLPLLKINDPIDKECAICIDKFEKDMEVIKLDCNHLFHKNCIKSYFLNYNNKCPMCRYQIN